MSHTHTAAHPKFPAMKYGCSKQDRPAEGRQITEAIRYELRTEGDNATDRDQQHHVKDPSCQTGGPAAPGNKEARSEQDHKCPAQEPSQFPQSGETMQRIEWRQVERGEGLPWIECQAVENLRDSRNNPQ